MADSLSFNGTDLSVYGLRFLEYDDIFEQLTESAQVSDKAIPLGSVRPPRVITIPVVIKAASLALRQSYVDSIKSVLNVNAPAVLKIDSITDRYWLAMGKLEGRPESAKNFIGTITFTCFDPNAYDNTETTSPHTIDADPKTFNEVVGGTAETKPVYTLTAGDTITAITITNATTGEEFEITVAMVDTDVLVINTATGVVTLNGTEVMTGAPVTSQFPKLLPGTNAFTVTGFSGAMVTVYPKRYA
jgi:predicted phage tail component-like protein